MPTDVAVGPDGSVWFLAFRANRLGRYREGRFGSFDVPGANAGLSGLAVAPDGTVWLECCAPPASAVGAMAGSTSCRSARAGWPYNIAVDGVGNVWYADLTGHVGMLPAATAAR